MWGFFLLPEASTHTDDLDQRWRAASEVSAQMQRLRGAAPDILGTLS